MGCAQSMAQQISSYQVPGRACGQGHSIGAVEFPGGGCELMKQVIVKQAEELLEVFDHTRAKALDAIFS